MPLVGQFYRGRPFLKCRLVLRRLAFSAEIAFMVDTGSDRTMLQPGDGVPLGLDCSRLEGSARTFGIGGVASNFVEPAIRSMQDAATAIHIYRFDLVITPPSQFPMSLPSLLGRDILNRWHMTYRPIDNHLEFEVASADATVELN